MSSEIKLRSCENFALYLGGSFQVILGVFDSLHFASRSMKSLKYRSSPGTDFSHIRLSPAYILRCKADCSVIENVITKPKDFVRETKKKKKKKMQIERQLGFSSLQTGHIGYLFHFSVSVRASR